MGQAASELLASLADEYWQAFLSNEPVSATALGDRRYDDKLTDITPIGRKRVEGKYGLILKRAREIPESSLSAADKLTRTALLVELQAQLDYLSCHLEEWTVDPLGGPQVEFLNVESFQPIRSVEEGRAMVKRWQTIGPYMDDHVANLRRGLAMGKVAVRAGVEKVIDEVRELAGKPDKEWALLRPLRILHNNWTAAERILFHDGLSSAVQESVRPAFLRYLKFLESEVQPKARPQEFPGIMHIPGGSDCYRRLIRVHTSLDLSPEELHMTGLREVARINKEMELLGEKLFGTRDGKEVLRRLRTEPSLYFKSVMKWLRRLNLHLHVRRVLYRNGSAASRRPTVKLSVWLNMKRNTPQSPTTGNPQPTARGRDNTTSTRMHLRPGRGMRLRRSPTTSLSQATTCKSQSPRSSKAYPSLESRVG